MRGVLKGAAALPCLMLKAQWKLGWWHRASSSVSVLGERSVPAEPSASSSEPARIPWELLCAVLCVHGITLQTWGRHSVQEQSVDHRAGAWCDLGNEAGNACRLRWMEGEERTSQQGCRKFYNRIQTVCRIVPVLILPSGRAASLVPRNWGVWGGLFAFFVWCLFLLLHSM